ncbi:hypothetical protein POM88_028115 [Heracleum sosnowskyi]|uniref:Uncharacterized protein n=1 Tax=Heracleum sosnowskyi TaxID=360622 RepID=A0AAD8IAB3_9APIA|nr:hypothetical protein POM88_028115 [Heracleum sosnowskyi]
MSIPCNVFIGGATAVLICIVIFSAWVVDDLHKQLATNMEKLATFLQGFGDEFFQISESEITEDKKASLQAYKSVPNSKGTEETLLPALIQFGNARKFCKMGTKARSVQVSTSTVQENAVSGKTQMAFTTKQMSLIVATFGVLSFIFGVIAENKMVLFYYSTVAENNGKTSMASTVGISSDFPYVKIVSAESIINLSESTKCAQIVKASYSNLPEILLLRLYILTFFSYAHAGVAQYMKTEWRVVAIFNLILFVFLDSC